jgi:hypothetical protein
MLKRGNSLTGGKPYSVSGKEFQLRVTLKVKQLLDCPLESKDINVQLLWGRTVGWGGQKHVTSTETCINRKVSWDAERSKFEYECKVYLENTMPTDGAARDRLYKKQPASAHLYISVQS